MSVEYRVDELARAAGTTVRNVRVYQDRGLLAPPRKQGRVGFFDDSHLARLKLIGQLLERGYTFAHITELTAAFERGGDIGEVLGLEQVLTGPWSDEIPDYVTADALAERFGPDSSADTIAQAVRAGLLEPEGDRFRVPSPRLLNAGAEMVAAGIPLADVLALATRLRQDLAPAARALVGAVTDSLLRGKPEDWIPAGAEGSALAEVVARLRPLAGMAVQAYFAKEMERAVQDVLGARFVAAAAEGTTGPAGTATPRSVPDGGAGTRH